MDMMTAAIVGHSFGGATTIQALSEDSRFKWANTIIKMSYCRFCMAPHSLAPVDAA